MTSGFRNGAGQDFDDLYDPDVIGDGPTAGFLRRMDGSALRYAHIQYGSKGPDNGFRNEAGTDTSNLWAAKGTAVYALPINGGSYSANNQSRGGAEIRLQLFGDGTYQVLLNQKVATPTFVVVASGTWLPAGDDPNAWTVVYEAVELGRSVIGSTASTGVTNQAPSATALSANPYCSGWSSATYTGTDASSHGYLRARLYRNGALRSTTTISYDTNVNGN